MNQAILCILSRMKASALTIYTKKHQEKSELNQGIVYESSGHWRKKNLNISLHCEHLAKIILKSNSSFIFWQNWVSSLKIISVCRLLFISTTLGMELNEDKCSVIVMYTGRPVTTSWIIEQSENKTTKTLTILT